MKLIIAIIAVYLLAVAYRQVFPVYTESELDQMRLESAAQRMIERYKDSQKLKLWKLLQAQRQEEQTQWTQENGTVNTAM